jgi:DMATS type aromatic prenyltransferase
LVTFLDHGSRHLTALCEALAVGAPLRREALDVFRRLTSPWGERPIGARPLWPSDITDDHTPYEFSLAIERSRPELRMLVEAQADEASVFAQWDAGRALSTRLERDYGAVLERLRGIEDLFEIEDPTCRFGMWHAVTVSGEARPEFKVYLNPNAKGPARAAEIVGEAMARLGFGDALSTLPLDAGDLKYFSLDLTGGGDARAKIYLVHHRCTAADLEAALSVAANYSPGEATEFCRSMSGGVGPYMHTPLQTCYAFTTRGGDRPVAGTLYFPIRSYVESDEIARIRVRDYMMAEDRPLYDRVLAGFAGRDLDVGTGMQTYASYRRQNGSRRVTIYLSPEAYAAGPRQLTSDPDSGVVLLPRLRDTRPPPAPRLAAGSRSE